MGIADTTPGDALIISKPLVPALRALARERSIKGSAGNLFVWGVINLGLWLWMGQSTRELADRLRSQNPEDLSLLVIGYAGAIIGSTMVGLGILAAITRLSVAVIVNGLALIGVGILNLGAFDSYAAVKLHSYGYVLVGQSKGLEFWGYLGLAQLFWGAREFWRFYRITRWPSTLPDAATRLTAKRAAENLVASAEDPSQGRLKGVHASTTGGKDAYLPDLILGPPYKCAGQLSDDEIIFVSHKLDDVWVIDKHSVKSARWSKKGLMKAVSDTGKRKVFLESVRGPHKALGGPHRRVAPRRCHLPRCHQLYQTVGGLRLSGADESKSAAWPCVDRPLIGRDPSGGGLCVPPSVQKDSPYHYIASLTEALSYAKSGLDRTAQQGSGSASGFDLFLALKLAKGDFDCAGSQVSAYSASSNEAIKTSAEGAAFAFALLAKLQDRSAAEYKALLDSTSEGKLKPGTVLERQAELAAAYDEAWKLLIPAVIAGTYAVVEENPKTGLMSGLALTRTERDAILRKLRVTFGDDIARGLKAGQLPLTAAAAALYQVVGDRQRQLREPK